MNFHESQSLSSLKLLFNYFFTGAFFQTFPQWAYQLSRWSPRLNMLPQMLPLLDDPWRLHWRQLWRTVAVEWCCGCYLVYYILWYMFIVFVYWYWYIIHVYPAGPWHFPWNFPHGVGCVSLSTATGRGIASSQIEFVTGVGEWQLRSFVKF